MLFPLFWDYLILLSFIKKLWGWLGSSFVSLPAKTYINNVFEWIDDLLDDETILETEIEVIDTETDSEKEEVVDSVDSSDLDVKKLEETENDW